MKKEAILQRAISGYIRKEYPGVLFNADLSGIKLPIGQATQLKRLRSGRAYPDLVIYEKRANYGACFIELKTTDPYKKDGELRKNKHLKEQETMLKKLREKGYFAQFSVGFDNTKRMIDAYLQLPKF
jgi:hypothetical protein